MAQNIVGSAYVQILPTTKGIANNITKGISQDLNGSNGFSKSGGLLGSNLAKSIATGVAVVGIGKLVSSSIMAGGELEQALGGVRKLFGNAFSDVEKNASKAYKTAGISATEYMNQATKFSASLLQSLGGNQKEAAKVADMAIRDMSDNASTFGTDIQSIQDAYQGFARGNFTMLDNLRLGYSGTKEEMQRLLQDAEKISGKKYDISNLSDVYEAIHLIQGELDITGNTANEAAKTFQGSFAMLKNSFTDALASLSTGNGNIEQLFSNLGESVVIFGQNILRMVKNIILNIPSALSGLINGVVGAIFDSLGLKFSGIDFSKIFNIDLSSFSSAFDSIKNLDVASIFNSVITQLSNFVDYIKNIFSGVDLGGIIGNLISTVGDKFMWLINLISPIIVEIKNKFFELMGALEPILTSVLSLLTPLFNLLNSVINYAVSILGGIFTVVLQAVSFLFGHLTNSLTFLTPVINVLVSVLSFLINVLSNNLHLVSQVISKFVEWMTTSEVVKNALQIVFDFLTLGIRNTFTVVKTCVKIGIDIFNSLKETGENLKTALSNAWERMKNAVKTSIDNIKNFIENLKSKFDSLKNIDLLAAGKAIINSFLNGLKSAFEGVKNFIGGIGTWIKNHKGPISYDRKLLIPAGKYIMLGLSKGLTDNFKDVKENVSNMADEIYNSFTLSDLDDKFNKDIAITSIKSYKVLADDTRDTKKTENYLIDVLNSLDELLNKNSDVFIDSEKASSILAPKIDAYKNKRDLYQKRREGVFLNV